MASRIAVSSLRASGIYSCYILWVPQLIKNAAASRVRPQAFSAVPRVLAAYVHGPFSIYYMPNLSLRFNLLVYGL